MQFMTMETVNAWSVLETKDFQLRSGKLGVEMVRLGRERRRPYMLKYSTGYEKLIAKLQHPKLSTIVGYEHGLGAGPYAQLNWL